MTRIQKIQNFLSHHALDALIIDYPVDLYYLTGLTVSCGRLVIEPTQTTFFVDGRYFEACQKQAPCSVVLTSGYDPTSAFGSWWPLQNKRVGFDAQTTAYADFEQLKTLNTDLVPLTKPIGRVREIKEPQERAALREAAALGSQGMDFVLSHLKEGVTEKEMVKSLEIYWLHEGGERLAFPAHIAFGESSSQPHYTVSDRKLKQGDLVLIDIGVVLNHYHSDMTRVVSFGKPSAEIEQIYQIVYEAFQAAIQICRPGVKISDVDEAARDLIKQAGFGDRFTHGLGHGVGLEIHESPRIRSIGPDATRVLEEGMVITIEPGIYLPGVGGVRLEDMILITASGSENLTNRPLSPQLARISHTFSDSSHTLHDDLAVQMGEAVLLEHCPHPSEQQSQSAERRSVQKKCEKSRPGSTL
jgi:Xaa-Pro aminopeptidase